MPTLPPEQTRPDPAQPHRARGMAESFGGVAERYDRTRPRYPDAMIARIAAAGPGPDVLDVGCGTGIAARQFQQAGCTVLGVEPDGRMAGVARQHGTPVEEALFEDWDPAGRTYDTVVAGQAWHWVDPAAGAAKALRVLRPAGLLAPFWNVFRMPERLGEAVADVCARALPDAPFDFRAMTRRPLDVYQEFFTGKVVDGIRRAGGFGEPELWRVDWEHTYTREAWLDVMPTQGAFTRLPPGTLAEVLQGVGDAVDAEGGQFTMRYATVAVAAVRGG